MLTQNLFKSTPQLSQLEILFKGPLLKDSQVATKNDLLLLNNASHYQDKLIWVINEKTFYYLLNGDGSLLTHWKKYVTTFPYFLNENQLLIIGNNQIIHNLNSSYISGKFRINNTNTIIDLYVEVINNNTINILNSYDNVLTGSLLLSSLI